MPQAVTNKPRAAVKPPKAEEKKTAKAPSADALASAYQDADIANKTRTKRTTDLGPHAKGALAEMKERFGRGGVSAYTFDCQGTSYIALVGSSDEEDVVQKRFFTTDDTPRGTFES